LKLDDILKNGGESQMEQKKYIEEKCKEQNEEYEPFTKDFFEIPKNWFIKDKGGEELWESYISIATTRNFKHFGVLNKNKATYLAYSNIEDEESEKYMDKEF